MFIPKNKHEKNTHTTLANMTREDDEDEHEDDAVAVEAFGDARALVGGGAGLSPRTLKRNERDLLRALSHSHDGGNGDAARRDVRSTHDATFGAAS